MVELQYYFFKFYTLLPTKIYTYYYNIDKNKKQNFYLCKTQPVKMKGKCWLKLSVQNNIFD